jgi:DNA-binding protein H-NS
MAVKLDELSPKELQALIADATSRVHGARSAHIRQLRGTILALIKAEGLELAEVFPAVGGKATGKAPSKRAGAGIAKYRNPADPAQTWTGFGKKPNWFIEALRKRGVSAETMLIAPGTAPAPAASPARATKKTARKLAAKTTKSGRKTAKR